MPITMVSILLGLLFLVFGGLKLAGTSFEREMFEAWGYPMWFMFVVGAYEFAAGVMFLHPRSSFVAASMVLIEMVGAAYTHVQAAETAMLALPVTVFLASAVVWWWRRPGQEAPARRRRSATA